MEDIDPELRGPNPSFSAANGNGHDESAYPAIETAANGNDQYMVHGTDEDQWLDGHYDLDDYDSYNQQSASYPSRLLAPIAPMLDPEQSYPDPSHSGQNRMMGIGYYQQGSGIDRILYDPPNANESVDDSPQRNTLSQNPNLAFSDLLDPQLQEPEKKKRKRLGEGSGDEDDVEFFTSNRQKQLAKAKRSHNPDDDGDEGSLRARPMKKFPPRRSTGKPQSYTDLGEDAVPIEEDEDPSVLSHRKYKDEDGDDLDLAAKAMRHLSNPAKERPAHPAPKRRRRRTEQTGSPSTAQNTIKTPRKSAWLARKEADEAGINFPEELPKRTRRRHSEVENEARKSASLAIEVSSGSEGGDNETGAIDDVDMDSLFGEPIEEEKSDNTGITWRPSEMDPNVQVAERSSSVGEVQQKPAPKQVSEGAEM
jgi:hypothetical protein